jgi:hypothetical protein
MRSYRFGSQKGVALFLCLFALLLLTSIGMGLMFMANTETTINYNYRSSMQAFYAAKAGVAEGVDRLRAGDATANYSLAPPTTFPTKGAATGVTYILNPAGSETVAPWDPNNAYFDNELCHERFLDGSGSPLLGVTLPNNGVACSAAVNDTSSYYTSTSALGTFGANTAYKWARITLKQNGTTSPYCVDGSACLNSTANVNSKVCWDGNNERTLASLGYTDCGTPPSGGNPYSNVYVVTALAKAPGATGARRMYQAEYAPAPPLNVTSAVASKAGVNLTGQLTVNGYDQCSCKQVGSDYAVARYAGGTCDTSKTAIYSANNVDNPNASETVVAGTGPIVQNVGVGNWPSSLDVPTLINNFKPTSVNVATCSSGSCSLNSGTNLMGTIVTLPPTDPASITTSGQISYVGGNITMNGGGGSGVLLVDGDLTIHGGGFQWYGLILVKGTVTFQGGGSASTNIYGAVIAGQDTNANIDTTLGGSVNIMLDKCAIANSFKGRPLTYISSRELIY